MRDFESFMSQLQETSQSLGFFCDFDKIGRNVEEIRLSRLAKSGLILPPEDILACDSPEAEYGVPWL